MKKLVLIKPWKLKAVRQRLDCNTAYHPHTTTTTQFVAACGPHSTEEWILSVRSTAGIFAAMHAPVGMLVTARLPRG